MKEKGGLNILDALENLNTLVEAQSLDEIEVTDSALLIPHKGEQPTESVEQYWVKAGADEQTAEAIKETLRTVHTYLHTFYAKMKRGGDTKRLVEGINTVMVLVGEAAKNLDTIGNLFKERVADFEEYRQLQSFYRNRVIKESFHEFAKIPIAKTKAEVAPELQEAEEELQAMLGEEVEETTGVHILNDLDVIKKDHLYELFYLKNEAGHNFYTFELARNIKLACDFGEFTGEYFGDDPLLQVKNWEDKQLHLLANDLLTRCGAKIEKFYGEAMKHKGMDVVVSLHNALMALMLAANPRNLIRQFALKGSHLYFHDFLFFLRETLHNREYQKFLIYAPPAGQPFFKELLDLAELLCSHLYTSTADMSEVRTAIEHITTKGKHKKGETLSEHLVEANHALGEALNKHPSGPVFKAVDIVREEQNHQFDPLLQGNLPAREWTLKWQEQEVPSFRLPCPTVQHLINHAEVSEEFKTFLGSLGGKEQVLLFNYQDRTSWKEHARCAALEELSRQAEFASHLSVVTLAADTEFYHQAKAYQELDEAPAFIDHFQDHLADEATGYYFAASLKKELFPTWIHALLKQVHHTFFGNKRTLSFVERLDFIELTYHFIELKIITLIKPNYLYFTSKDGLDATATASLGLRLLIETSKGKKWSEQELNALDTWLFAPTLMQRERAIHPERFERLVSMLRLLESKGDYMKAFAALF